MKLGNVDFETYYRNYPNAEGYFGRYGGVFVEEKLKKPMAEITDAYFTICKSRKFIAELRRIRKEFQGRPTPVTHLERLSNAMGGGVQLYAKREDLNHSGAHKLNHCMGEALLAHYMGKKKVEGILDGTIDMIATDHAPHSAEEKGRGLEKSAFGIVGLETAFPVLYTYMVRAGVMTMDKLVETMCVNPRKRFGIPQGNDFSVWDLGKAYTVDPETFKTMGRATPFTGHTLRGTCLMTVVDGHVVYKA